VTYLATSLKLAKFSVTERTADLYYNNSNNNNNNGLIASFQDKLSKLLYEGQTILDFATAGDDGSSSGYN